MIGDPKVSIKKFNDMRDALDQLEGALFGCELIQWEEFEELFQAMDDQVILRLAITVEQFKRLKAALDKANDIINDEAYARIK